MVTITPKQIGFLILCVLLGTVLCSGVYLFDSSGTKSSLGLIEWGVSFPYFAVIFILFLIGAVCGTLVISLINISKGMYVLLASLITGLLTAFLYTIVTLFANVEFLFRPTNLHYAWSGALGYIGDALFVFVVVFILFGLFIVLGSLVGGAIRFLITKRNTSRSHL